MAEYIERDAAMLTPVLPKEYRQYQTENLDDAYEQGWLDALGNLKNAPAADVEPVVHCRDCKYQTKRKYSDKRFRHGGYYIYGCENMENCDLGQDNDFCARGERKIT